MKIVSCHLLCFLCFSEFCPACTILDKSSLFSVSCLPVTSKLSIYGSFGLAHNVAKTQDGHRTSLLLCSISSKPNTRIVIQPRFLSGRSRLMRVLSLSLVCNQFPVGQTALLMARLPWPPRVHGKHNHWRYRGRLRSSCCFRRGRMFMRAGDNAERTPYVPVSVADIESSWYNG